DLERVKVFGRADRAERELVLCFGEPHDRYERPLPVGREAVAEHEVVPHDPFLRPLELLTRVRRGERQFELCAPPDSVRDQRRARLLRFGLVVRCHAETDGGDDTHGSEQECKLSHQRSSGETTCETVSLARLPPTLNTNLMTAVERKLASQTP